MKAKEKKELEHELQELVIAFDSLYARCLVGVSKGSVLLEEKVFDALAIPDSISRLDCGHYAGKTKNGLRITTVRD